MGGGSARARARRESVCGLSPYSRRNPTAALQATATAGPISAYAEEPRPPSACRPTAWAYLRLPTRRRKRADEKRVRERDAFLVACSQRPEDDDLRREAVYAEWLNEQFRSTGAASVLEARMTRFQLTPVLRRTQAVAGDGTPRQSRSINGPDAVFTGHLRVEEPDAFARLLARGVGRHRAFGFGMLVLKPASIDG
ncbi:MULTISPECIES: type I-E CRISPR-associated protein Cas6/Cse3/CasE [unclassified Caballeronia]|uniref:type I-E CRISPR-associated protein Cas6/Cse3/CasE n=1 Tax=unclassified Caballeronia TaxID=2646786 RepID=UPI0015883AE7|nr:MULTISPECIES: type I-E CRISPR-associated protein Cas6/Cse3/CasE [unclassified Caballeronia]QSN63328.1 type I-E CRISPR-associated protein Cas6/Cse3/CasE [Caballeronia sp. M1242]